MSYFTYNDKQVYYEETGEGTPLILLHGNTSCGKMFEPIVPALSAEYRPAGVREGSQMVHMHLLFRRGTDNRMILTSANLNFQSVEPPAPSETDEEA